MAFEQYTIISNGIPVEARFNPKQVDEVFLPLLRKLTRLQQEKGKRLVVFLAAPPGTGKTTLSLFLEALSKQHGDVTDVQCVGMDGFHHYQSYLTSHRGFVYGKDVLLAEVKGAPESFDFEKFRNKVLEIKQGDAMWPIYDRQNLHDVVEDQISVTGDIVLVEGNWLILKDEGWRDLHELCDYCIFVETKEAYVKERLIGRKISGGSTRQEAESFYKNADGRNVVRCIEDSMRDVADTILELQEDGDYILIR